MRHLFLAAAVLSTAAFAQSEYFPLQTGNTWVYRLTGPRIQPPIAGTQMFVMSVGEPIAVDGVEYWNVDGVPGVGNAKLRYSDSGRLVAFDEESKSEKVWLSFSAGMCTNVYRAHKSARATVKRRCR